jgi:uncharacterized protein (DUF1778 family)
LSEMTADTPLRRPIGDRAIRSERLELRVSPEEKQLLSDAATATQRTVSQFVVQSAAIAANDVLADRRSFVVSEAAWNAFAAALEREPRSLPRLANLLAEPSILDAE